MKPKFEHNPENLNRRRIAIRGTAIKFFEKYQGQPDELISALEAWVSPFLHASIKGFDSDTLAKSLQQLNTVSPEAFADSFLVEFEPLIIFMEERPVEFERIQREQAARGQGNVRINDLLYFNRSRHDTISINVTPSNYVEIPEKLRQFREALSALAVIVKEDKSIKVVEATSWIVADSPKLMKLLGFTLHGEISEELKRENYPEEERPVHFATISREDFLARYLKK